MAEHWRRVIDATRAKGPTTINVCLGRSASECSRASNTSRISPTSLREALQRTLRRGSRSFDSGQMTRRSRSSWFSHLACFPVPAVVTSRCVTCRAHTTSARSASGRTTWCSCAGRPTRVEPFGRRSRSRSRTSAASVRWRNGSYDTFGRHWTRSRSTTGGGPSTLTATRSRSRSTRNVTGLTT